MTNHGQGTWHLEHSRNSCGSVGMEVRESKKGFLGSTYFSSVVSYNTDYCRKYRRSMEYNSYLHYSWKESENFLKVSSNM